MATVFYRLVLFVVITSVLLGVFVNADMVEREAQIAHRLSELYRNETFARLHFQTFGPKPRVKRTFPCTTLAPSSTKPTSVHQLRPGDINVVAAMGDSLTAGRGSAGGIIALLVDYRGLSWSIGGDAEYEDLITVPNILRKYNPNLYGFSVGTGTRNFPGARLNVAETGDESQHLMEQTEMLVDRFKNDRNVDFENDWKLITLFIGGNDLCDYCFDKEAFTVEKYRANIQASLDFLHENVPKVFVNLVEVLNIEIAEELANNLLCDILHVYSCDCAANPKSKEMEEETIKLKNSYQEATRDLVASGRYDTREDFTVVLQPFYRNTYLPRTPDGEVDYSYFASDCFHHSVKGQQAAGISLWNNMVEPVGAKKEEWSPGEDLECPTEDWPYLYTSQNGPTMKVVGNN